MLSRSLRPSCARIMAWAVSVLMVASCARPAILPTVTGPSFKSVTAAPAPTTPAPAPMFDGDRAYRSVVEQVGLGPRITGSEQNLKLGNMILSQLAANGWTTQTQVFDYQQTMVRNLVGVKGGGKNIVILGAHYDTRRRADQDPDHPELPVPGADDGASGVAVLLELSRVLQFEQTDKQVWLVFFDAEDDGELDGWDWLVGSRHFADNLTITPQATIIIDMIGDQQQDLYYERNSTAALEQQIWSVAKGLGYESQFHPSVKWDMTDDHTPFLQHGWPAVDIIDFDYPYWHTTHDTPDKISAQSLERVGRTLQLWVDGIQ